jgi:hypothetical protein
MNSTPGNLDIATRDSVDMLISRIADAEARSEDWAAFNQLAERHPWAWRELAQAQRDHTAMSVAVGVAIQSADTVFLPSGPGVAVAGHGPRPLFSMWAGWAVAACLGLAMFGGLRLPVQTVPTSAAGVDLTKWTPNDYLNEYVSKGEKSGLVLGEVPQRVLIDSRPLQQGEGFEVLYVRQFVERAQVSDLLKFTTDESGRAVPVRQLVPAVPGAPE